MAWGTLYDTRVGYAVGIFNGFRNGIIDTNDFKDVVATINFKPFLLREDSWLQHLNIGGSVAGGRQDNPVDPAGHADERRVLRQLRRRPRVLRIQQQRPRVRLPRVLGSAHGLLLPASVAHRRVAERLRGLWHLDRRSPWPHRRPRSTQPPRASSACPSRATTSWPDTSSRARPSAAGAWSSRIQDFDLRRGKFGLGALELASRFNQLNFGNQVFTGGLADPNLWTNNLYTIDVGVNWYWTQYIKVSLFWEHAGFGNPVTYAPNLWHTNSNEAILRMQIYF